MEQQQCACAAEGLRRKYPKQAEDIQTWLVGCLVTCVMGFLMSNTLWWVLSSHHARNALSLEALAIIAVAVITTGSACLIATGFLVRGGIAFLIRNGIGQRVYCFRDRAGREHAHAEEPEIRTTYSGVPFPIANANAYDTLPSRDEARAHLVDGPILKLRRGGWFRTCAVIGNLQVASRWRVWSWNGDTVRCTDADGCAIGPLPVSAALDIIRSARSVREWMSQKRAAEAAREILGSGLAEMEHVLQRAPRTIGRTKHAKVLLHLINRIFAQFTPFRDTGMQPPPTAADVESMDGKPSAIRIADWAIAAARIDDAALIREALGENPKPEPRPDHPAQENA